LTDDEVDSSWEEDINRVRQKFRENIELRAPVELVRDLLASIGRLYRECSQSSLEYEEKSK